MEREVKKKMSERSPLRRRRFALDCSAIEEEEEKKIGLPQRCFSKLARHCEFYYTQRDRRKDRNRNVSFGNVQRRVNHTNKE